MTDYLELLPEEEDALPDEGGASSLSGAARFFPSAALREENGAPPQIPSPASGRSGGNVPLQGRLNTAEGALSSPPAFPRTEPDGLSVPAPALLEQTLRLERTARRAGAALRPPEGTARAGRRTEFSVSRPLSGARLLDLAAQRDSRRYDNGFILY